MSSSSSSNTESLSLSEVKLQCDSLLEAMARQTKRHAQLRREILQCNTTLEQYFERLVSTGDNTMATILHDQLIRRKKELDHIADEHARFALKFHELSDAVQRIQDRGDKSHLALPPRFAA
jgi:hypothetical protein